jgi:hypothetical protein
MLLSIVLALGIALKAILKPNLPSAIAVESTQSSEIDWKL